MNEIKLKRCPFCGGEVLLDREDIFCDNCHLSMRIFDRYLSREAETYQEARIQTIEQWNTRKPMEEIVERLEEGHEWARTHGAYERFREGRVSGFRTAIRIVKEVGGMND